MKFGFRKPSLRKRIAARTSFKRFVRQNLGLKAPRGWGWLTNPRKAAYNRVYRKTTFGLGDLLKPRRRARSAGCLVPLLLLLVTAAHADVVWSALWVWDSHFRFWYVSILGFLLEAGVLFYWLKTSIRKALLISLVVNAFSASVGMALITIGMIGWEGIVAQVPRGMYYLFDTVGTLLIMFVASVWLETLLARLIWKYPVRKTFPVLLLGNVLSYAVVAVDLFALGGWSRTF